MITNKAIGLMWAIDLPVMSDSAESEDESRIEYTKNRRAKHLVKTAAIFHASIPKYSEG